MTYTLSINLVSEKATKFRRSNGGASCEGIAVQPQVMELVDGALPWQKERSALYDERRIVYSDDYKNRLKNIGLVPSDPE